MSPQPAVSAADRRQALRSLDGPGLFACLYAMLALTASPHIPLLMLLPVAAMLLPGWQVSRRLSHRSGYRAAWHVAMALVVAGLCLAAGAGWLHPEPALAGIALFLMVRGWFLPRALRQHLELWCLGLVLLLIGSLHGGGTAGMAVLAGWMIASFHLLNLMAVLRMGGGDSPYRQAPLALRTIYGLLPLAVLLTVVLVIVLPRVPQGTPDALPLRQLSALERDAVRVGFSETVSLTALTSIAESPAIAFVVTDPDDGFDASTARFRVATLDAFDGWQWTRSAALESRAARTVVEDGACLFPGEARPGTRHDFLLLRPVDFSPELIPLPEEAVALAAVPDGTEVVMGDDGRLALRSARPAAEHLLALAPGAPTRVRRGDVLASHLQVPAALHTPIGALMSRIGGAPTARGRAEALEAWLRRNGTYSRTPGIESQGPAALEEFLVARRGHCELFATAMALALRRQGIPSRLVTGFVGASALPGAAGRPVSYAVPQNHAHAWVEAWIEGEGWQRFDPTPPLPLSLAESHLEGREIARALADQDRHLAGWLESYDYDAQQRLWSGAWERVAGPLRTWEHGALPRAIDRLRANASEPPIMALAAGLALLNGLLWLWKFRASLRTWRLRRAGRGTRPVPPLLEQILSAAGRTPSGNPATSPAEMLRGADETWAEVLALYERWRYGGHDPAVEAAIRGKLRAAREAQSSARGSSR